ncbi:MAG: hypothetical protein JXR60_08655 [Bacteroidales bacterium]|nr:hypothetical protein [Bacteroidales bacterium]
MIKVFIISILLVAISGILLATSIIFKKLILNKRGFFPNTSVGHNPNMQKLGITCAKGDAWKEFKQSKEVLGCSTDESTGGCSCG